MLKHYTFTFFMLVLVISSLFSQNGDFNEQFNTAEEFIQEQNFLKAIDILKPMVEKHPDNANLNFKLGFCYLQTSYEKPKSVQYFKEANKNTTDNYFPDNPGEKAAPLETPFFLARAYYHNHNFTKADSSVRAFKNKVEELANEEYLAEVDRFIQTNQNAKEITKNPIDVKVNPLPKGINTKAIEFGPVVSGDEKTLIFTSNREPDGDLDITNNDDLYIAKKVDGEWQQPKRMDNISTEAHEASVSLSFDGNTLIIYINEDGDGGLFQSNYDGTKWSKPQKMPEPINSDFLETHGCYSPDKKEFFFTSNRPGGQGGLDIYMSRKLPNGMWSAPTNLGPTINTPYNEDSPFMHPDEKRLYFSSSGHNTMGGLDIFVAERKSVTEWAKPKNIGYPINSTSDDVGFSVSVDGKRGYYASFNDKSLGETDLFMIDMPGEDHTNLIVYVGYAKNKKGEIIENAEITAFNIETGEMHGVYTPNPRTGKFVLAAEKGVNLRITIEADGYKPIEKVISMGTDNEEKTEFVPEKPIENIEMQPDWKIPEYILMPYAEYQTSMDKYESLLSFLQTETNVEIILTGHTDAIGSDKYNMRLSKKRAAFVKNYLTQNSIDKERIQIKAKGESCPVARNKLNGKDNPEGRKYNRRVEIKIKNAGEDLFTIEKVVIPEKHRIKNEKGAICIQ